MAYFEERKTSEGTTKYRVQVRLKGFPTQSATFDRKTDARKWAQDTESSIRNGRHFKTIEAKKHTLAELIDRYIESVLPNKPKSEKKQKAQLLWFKERIGNYSLADVTPALIAQCRDELLTGKTSRSDKRSNSTVVRYLAALSHAFTIAVKEWGWVEDNPVKRVSKPKEPRGRIRFLMDDERERLLKVCKGSRNPNLYAVVVIALSTGARQSEIMNLTWRDVDFSRRVIYLHETKNNELRVLPLAGHALELIRELSKIRHIDTELLFPGQKPSRPFDIRYPWERAIKQAEIEDFRFHDLRHSAASYLAMNGASLAEIAEILGHKTLAMVKRYSHLSEQHTAKVVAKMNEQIFS